MIALEIILNIMHKYAQQTNFVFRLRYVDLIFMILVTYRGFMVGCIVIFLNIARVLRRWRELPGLYPGVTDSCYIHHCYTSKLRRNEMVSVLSGCLVMAMFLLSILPPHLWGIKV